MRVNLKAATIASTIIAGLLVGLGMAVGEYQHTRPVYRVVDQRTGYSVGVSCSNGGDPTIEGNFGGNGAQEWQPGGTGSGSIEQARIDLAYAQRIRVLGAL